MSEVTTQENKPIYDASKNYQWKPTDKFELTGQEFAFIFGVMNTKRVELLQGLETLSILEKKLIDAVESGVAIERVINNSEDEDTGSDIAM